MSTNDQRLQFGQTVEGMFLRGLKDRLTPRLKQRLREKGLDLDRTLEPGYPVESWIQYLRIACEEVYPGVAPKEAQRQLGMRFFNGYAETFVGKAMLRLLRLVGPMKALMRMERNFRSGNNFVQTRFRQLGPASAELWFNEVLEMPSWVAGVIEAGGTAIGAKRTQVETVSTDGHQATYRVTWTP